MHIPDLWIILEWNDSHHVLASWRGGYISPDSWRRSSRIVHVEDHGACRVVETESGSQYKLYKNAYGVSPHCPIETIKQTTATALNKGQAEVFLQQFSQSA